jgi:hypothetical protein
VNSDGVYYYDILKCMIQFVIVVAWSVIQFASMVGFDSDGVYIWIMYMR